jgi:hypothetical protein
LLVGHREAADVEALDLVGGLGVPVDAAEHQRRVAEVELRQAVDQRFVEHVALVAGLEGATERGLAGGRATSRRRERLCSRQS